METEKAFQEELARQNIDAVIHRVGCMGHCYAEPMVIIKKAGWPSICYGSVGGGVATALVKSFLMGDDPCFEFMLGALEENDLVPTVFELPRFKGEKRVLLERAGRINPEDIDDYIALDGYCGLAKALGMQPEEIVDQVKRSGLRGRGGAGFPTGRKWELGRNASGSPKYVVCNADEGDPGAFMDRTLLESDPHATIEGMIIAGFAVGSSTGYIYVRAEYPLAVERLKVAVKQAHEKGFLGKNILGSGFDFVIEITRGAGAFVCGESSALMYSIEGKRGMPRVRPPHSIEAGLWGCPTVLNNVKTFAAVPWIINRGPDWYGGIGTEKSKGTAVFALAGKTVNMGLVEVPMGTTLRELIYDMGGGVPQKKQFKAVQIGGPSGGCLPKKLLDIPIDFDSLGEAGAMMGSGGMIVLDEDNCMVETARFFLDFIQRESCGKCTLCRLGTKQMLDVLEGFTRGSGTREDIDFLVELGEDIKAGSLCNLGKTAPNPVLTTIKYFRTEYEAHILEKRCPSLMCKDLTTYYIVPEKCERACDACVGSCPVEAIFSGKNRIKIVDQEKCVKCNSCLDACPPNYNAVIKISPLSEVPESEPPPNKKAGT